MGRVGKNAPCGGIKGAAVGGKPVIETGGVDLPTPPPFFDRFSKSSSTVATKSPPQPRSSSSST